MIEHQDIVDNVVKRVLAIYQGHLSRYELQYELAGEDLSPIVKNCIFQLVDEEIMSSTITTTKSDQSKNPDQLLSKIVNKLSSVLTLGKASFTTQETILI